jgi:hypothetical protein
MKNLEIYENREKLYASVLKDLKLKKVDEKYYPESFGNFFVELSSKKFLIRYTMDRLFLTIQIASNSVPSKWYDLSFIKNFINNADKINPGDEFDNLTRINELNKFLKIHFDRINELLNPDNYKRTFTELDKLLREEFKCRFPGAVKD